MPMLRKTAAPTIIPLKFMVAKIVQNYPPEGKECNFALQKNVMEYLPQDPAMLVSAVNMLLRDQEYDSLESLCFSFDRDPEEIKKYLLEYDYLYNEQQKQFRPVM